MRVRYRFTLGFVLGFALAAVAASAPGQAAPAAVEIQVRQPVYFPGLLYRHHRRQRELVEPKDGLFVAPGGRPDAKGTVESPLDLRTVLSGKGPVKPGDVVWLMPGTYKGEFDSALKGTDEAPILVRGWPRKRVRIDGTLKVEGAHTWYWGFEVSPAKADHRKSAYKTGTRPGVDFTHGYRCRLINLIIHNAVSSGIGYHNTGREELSETYGCIIYDNGWQPPQEKGKYNRGFAHGWYIQNSYGEKFISDCISFNSWGYLLQVYASGSWVNGCRIEGNILFNPSLACYEPKPEYIKAPITFGGVHYPAEGLALIRQNYTYIQEWTGPKAASFDMRLGYKSLNDTLICTDNFMVGGYGFEMGQWRSKLIERNTFYLRGEKAYEPLQDRWKPPAGPDNEIHVLRTARPKAAMFAFRPNKYELGRGHLAIYNFPRIDAVTVDLGDLKGLPKRGRKIPTEWLKKGEPYEVRSVFRYFAEPVAKGVFDGTPITIDMRPLKNVPVGGNGRPLTQARPHFDAFVVLRGKWCMSAQ